MPTTEALLQEMLDEFQLRKLVHAYCRAVDRGDFTTLRELYHHDAEDAHGAFSTGDVDDFFNTLAASRPQIRSMQHNSVPSGADVPVTLLEAVPYGMHTPAA